MNTCRNCQHAFAKAGHERMHRRGFRNCAYLPEWQYVSGNSACRFNPIRCRAAA
ncbi:hypothetical protein NOV72_03704 [Caballeronia novacaledonica]|uniref:Uncharacterized protein n=1 Tax=Caballeronia novacaledonica TaxID=1544861 RepID=A0A2U3I8H1_9BURK|nr:hypothetical protein NOV72_03704 [Caballeronia novacaledonica]